jgi:hypothetical protein
MSKVQYLFTTMRRVILLSLVVLFSVISTSCGSPSVEQSQAPRSQQQTAQKQLSDGQYPVQQATYDDASGEYQLALLNTSPGQPSMLKLANLPMARLTNEEVSKGQSSYLKMDQGKPSLHLTEDFKIEYVHNVTQTETNPQTGESRTVVVQRESSFWTPFAGALAGQLVGNLLFTPQYYFPPVYQPGGRLTGFGGYGRTYDDAISNYRTRYKAPPVEVRNRQVFRTTGNLRSPNSRPTTTTSNTTRTTTRSTGSGFGSSTLRSSGSSGQVKRRSSSGFGSGSSRRVTRSRRR